LGGGGGEGAARIKIQILIHISLILLEIAWSRHNQTIEQYHAAMYKKDFTDLMSQLGRIVNMPGRDSKRVTRNVFGDLISDLTGLATGKELEAERIEIHDTNKKVKSLLEHEIVMDHAIERIGNELVKTNRSSAKVMAWVEHQMRLDAQYRSRKVRGWGGGAVLCAASPPPNTPH